MTQKTLVIDLDRCTGCMACEVACKQENGVPLGVYLNKVHSIGPTGVFPDIKQYFLPHVCQNCKDAPCVKVCPTKATYRTEDGQILVDKEKCTLCNHLQAAGEQPACVKACCAHARFFGDIDDPESDVSKAVKAAGPENVHAMRDVGNKPTVRYILHKKYGDWTEDQPKMLP